MRNSYLDAVYSSLVGEKENFSLATLFQRFRVIAWLVVGIAVLIASSLISIISDELLQKFKLLNHLCGILQLLTGRLGLVYEKANTQLSFETENSPIRKSMNTAIDLNSQYSEVVRGFLRESFMRHVEKHSAFVTTS